jgi:hypothetical protein
MRSDLTVTKENSIVEPNAFSRKFALNGGPSHMRSKDADKTEANDEIATTHEPASRIAVSLSPILA